MRTADELTAESLEKSKAADEIVIAARDNKTPLTAASAFSVLAALANGRIALREVSELVEINANLRAQIARPRVDMVELARKAAGIK